MPTCAAYACDTGRKAYTGEHGVQMFHFPEGRLLRQSWIENLGRSNYVWKKDHRVCSLHFGYDDFVPDYLNVDSRGRQRVRRQLKSKAVPRYNLKGKNNPS